MRRPRLSPSVPSATPAPPGDGGGLQRVLVPVRSIEESAETLSVATRFAQTEGGCLHLIHVRTWDPPTWGVPRFSWETSEEATAALDAAMTYAWSLGATASGVVVEADTWRIADAVVAEALDWSADVVVLVRQPRRLVPLGAWERAAKRVLQLAPCPILVVGASRV